eukprot:CAMPEP_0173301978 /NCGR_PEP_ID=MMETSP1143-20121109/18091_1 /TAXON_ID=483371 /ORGANISM="non described non described, Strain CCMP2298" /LENGTH=86 /DNA_ID=CAMNT_0014242551 /DNA_START=220 /DNA_END=480 /DNA_ORIENTATION=-
MATKRILEGEGERAASTAADASSSFSSHLRSSLSSTTVGWGLSSAAASNARTMAPLLTRLDEEEEEEGVSPPIAASLTLSTLLWFR